MLARVLARSVNRAWHVHRSQCRDWAQSTGACNQLKPPQFSLAALQPKCDSFRGVHAQAAAMQAGQVVEGGTVLAVFVTVPDEHAGVRWATSTIEMITGRAVNCGHVKWRHVDQCTGITSVEPAWLCYKSRRAQGHS
jgi:hypothetical protein